MCKTAQEIAEVAKLQKPSVRYAYSDNGNGVAAWSDGRWCTVAGKLIDGSWVSLPMELCINGIRMSDKMNWIEV